MLQVLVIFLGWLAHPFHVSVCDIEVNSKNQSLEISQRIFLDDLELALRKHSGWEKLDVLNPADRKRFDKLMQEYVTGNLQVSVNGRPVVLNYLGHEMEADAMWCYIEVQGVQSVNEIAVENRILLDTYDDQVNLIHIKNGGKIRSMKLYQNNARDAIIYN